MKKSTYFVAAIATLIAFLTPLGTALAHGLTPSELIGCIVAALVALAATFHDPKPPGA